MRTEEDDLIDDLRDKEVDTSLWLNLVGISDNKYF